MNPFDGAARSHLSGVAIFNGSQQPPARSQSVPLQVIASHELEPLLPGSDPSPLADNDDALVMAANVRKVSEFSRPALLA